MCDIRKTHALPDVPVSDVPMLTVLVQFFKSLTLLDVLSVSYCKMVLYINFLIRNLFSCNYDAPHGKKPNLAARSGLLTSSTSELRCKTPYKICSAFFTGYFDISESYAEIQMCK